MSKPELKLRWEDGKEGSFLCLFAGTTLLGQILQIEYGRKHYLFMANMIIKNKVERKTLAGCKRSAESAVIQWFKDCGVDL